MFFISARSTTRRNWRGVGRLRCWTKRLLDRRRWRCFPKTAAKGICRTTLAHCLLVTLGRRLKALAPGLTPRSLFEKFSAVQMIDVHIPTADGRDLQLTRY
jgi:hypothetical protein